MFKDRRTAMVGTLVLALFLSSLILTNPGKALAADAFLKIDGIEGDSNDSKHKNEIEVISWSFGDSQPATVTRSAAGGASAGKVTMQDFKFTMKVGKASPMLFGAVANGKHIKKAVLTVRTTSGQKQLEFLKISLEDVIVSSFISLGSKSTEVPAEEIMLNFGKIQVSYTQFDPQTGAPKGEIKSGWDLTGNKSY
jgi:type VI secretion system secreted protein Hcp